MQQGAHTVTTHLASARVGKTTVRVTGEGCVECGTTFSAAWFIGKTVPVQIGNRSFMLHLMKCLRCRRSRGQAEPTLPDAEPLMESGG